MGQNLQGRGQLRPVDLARRHGLSTQAIRNYEAWRARPSARSRAMLAGAAALDAYLDHRAAPPSHG